VHATASAIGISAILLRSATAFTVLKIVGACYLVLLGVLSFRSARHAHRAGQIRVAPSGRTSFVQVVMGIVWLFSWGWLASSARGVFTRPRWRAALERVTGCVLVGLGVRLATTSR
jgi:threonine/homoserine/homoserine lactone efflux protein